jgi:hypothetical protein
MFTKRNCIALVLVVIASYWASEAIPVVDEIVPETEFSSIDKIIGTKSPLESAYVHLLILEADLKADGDIADVEASLDELLQWGFIKTAIDKVKKNLPNYVAKGKAAISGQLHKTKAGIRRALKKAKAKFGAAETQFVSLEEAAGSATWAAHAELIKDEIAAYKWMDILQKDLQVSGDIDVVEAEAPLDELLQWGFIKTAIDKVKKNLPKYIAKGKAAKAGALDKAKGWLKGALKKAKATFRL